MAWPYTSFYLQINYIATRQESCEKAIDVMAHYANLSDNDLKKYELDFS